MMRLLACFAVGALGAHALPALPLEYSAVILLKLPYIPLEMPLRVSISTGAQQIQYYDGLVVETTDAIGTYKFGYNNSERVCMFSPPTSGPTENLGGTVRGFTPQSFLPDLKMYTQEADELVGGILCQKFSLNTPHGSTHTMDDHFTFYWDPVLMKPVRWRQHARSLPFGSHTDEYSMDFLHFEAGTPAASDLALPKLCQEQPTEAHTSSGLLNFLKTAREYEAYLKGHGKSYGLEEHEVRKSTFAKNKLLVEELNQKHAGRTTFKANRFMDLTKEEIMSFRGGKNKGSSKNRRTEEHQKYVRSHKTVGTMQLPTHFDWRTEMPGSQSPVKDQGVCGSCWAYGGFEPIESILAIHSKNKLVVLPEQFMVDCTWTNNTGSSGTNSGCDGGDSDIGVLEIVRKYGGVIPSAQAYGSYLSVNGYCKDINTMEVGAKVTGWVDVAKRNDDQLMHALVTQGPISVGIQVPDDMLYYDTGVLTSTQCKHNAPDIDHAVVVSGYGTQPGLGTDPDQDYWLIRNSWSTYWGDRGYIKIARGDLDCCVSCEAGYPEIAPAASSSVIV